MSKNNNGKNILENFQQIKTPKLVNKDSVPVSIEKSPYSEDDIIKLIKKIAETYDEMKIIGNNKPNNKEKL